MNICYEKNFHDKTHTNAKVSVDRLASSFPRVPVKHGFLLFRKNIVVIRRYNEEDNEVL